MGGAGLLDAPPAEAAWEFPPEEYRRRLEEARSRMAATGIECLFLTSEKNIRYLTGFHTQIWVSPTRPRFVLVPLSGEPVAIVPITNVPGFRATTWIADIRAWPAPRPEDDGVSLLIEALRTLVQPGGRIGTEIGPEMRVEMPIRDFLRVRDGVGDRTFVDAGPVLKPLRMRKSAHEVAYLRRIAQIASDAFDRARDLLRPGLTEREIYRMFQGLLIELGAEKVPYLVPASGQHGVHQVNMGPSERVLVEGDLLFLDCGASFHGYYCDFDRNFAIRSTTDELREAYVRVFEATQAGIAAIRPGSTTGDIWRHMADVLDPKAQSETPIGRMGHGLGLDITEPPSLARGDETVVERGMALCVEPSLVLPAGGSLGPRLMVHEEIVVVTETGCELLTRRAPPTLPVL